MVKTAQKTFARRNELAELMIAENKREHPGELERLQHLMADFTPITKFNPTGSYFHGIVEEYTIREVESAITQFKNHGKITEEWYNNFRK